MSRARPSDQALVSDGAASVSTLSGFDPSRVEPSDSLDYETTFYGILNKQGQFWSPMPFDSIDAAKERMARFKGAHLERTHKIVPVRIVLTAIAAGSGTDETSEAQAQAEGSHSGPKGIAQGIAP